MIVHYLALGYEERKASLRTGQQEFEWLFTPTDSTNDSGNVPLNQPINIQKDLN